MIGISFIASLKKTKKVRSRSDRNKNQIVIEVSSDWNCYAFNVWSKCATSDRSKCNQCLIWMSSKKANQVQKYSVTFRVPFQKTLDTFLCHISSQDNFSPTISTYGIKPGATFNVSHPLQATREDQKVQGINVA